MKLAMKLLLFLVVALCLVGSASAATHIINESMGTGYFQPSSFSPNAVPGDTIVFAADRVSGVMLTDFEGTESNPYTFTNPSDSTVVLSGVGTTSWSLQGIQVFDSYNFSIRGDNYSSETYGIEIHALTNSKSGIRMWRCSNWDISYIHIHDTLAGITQNNNDPWVQSNGSMGDCRVHHNLIEDTSATYAEGMYLGKSVTGDHPQWVSLEIDNNSVYRTGSDCIQAGQSASLLIHDNYCEDCGVQDDVGQNYGFMLSVEGAGIEIYRNTVVRSRHNGIEIHSSAEEPSIHDNVIWDAGFGASDANGIKVSSSSGSSSIISNTIINSTKDGIRTAESDTTGEIRYNLLIANDLSGINSAYSTQTDNRVQASIPNEYFVNAATGNFRLTSSSPAKDAGTAAGYSATDFDGVSRPQGSEADIGAFEFVESGSAPNITSWENDKTSNDTLDFTIYTSESVNFNATANQTITTWNWYKDDVDQSHNYDNISLSWSTPGLKHVIVNATNSNGTSSSITWNVTVNAVVDTSYFTYYKIITINQTMINQSIGTGTYPLLVSTTDTDLRDNAQADGDDIVFFDSDNTTRLPYEQELWNSTTGELVEWVGIEDATNVSYIVMYYNNSTIANSENATGVWDSNYMMVQHFQETDIDGGAGDIKDSTSNDNDGTTHNMTTANLDTGLINGCYNFSKSNEARVNVSDDATLDGFTSGFTISGLFNFNQEGAYYLVNKYDAGGDQRAWLLKLEGDDNIRIYVDDAGTAAEISNFNPTIVPGTDYKIDAVWESGEYPLLYFDGALANEVDHDGLVSSIKDSSSILRIGGGYSPGNTLFTGDEIRVSNIARSHAYIETDYNNTASPDLFISIGAEQGGGAPDTKFEYWDGTAWQENPADYHLWFECFWNTSGYPDGVCSNAEQSGSQHSLRITNNGTAAGIPKMKFNESSPAEVTVYVDDDYTVAGAVVITNSYQAVGASLGPGENVTLSSWAKLEDLTSIWEYIIYVEVQ